MDLEARPTPQPGRFGRFYLQELINSGGMADIWVATDPQGAAFALRRLHDDLRFNFLARRRSGNTPVAAIADGGVRKGHTRRRLD